MLAHAWDLRAELPAYRPELSDAEREVLVEAASTDWRQGDFSTADQALCTYAEKLTRDPAAMAASDVEALRSAGFDDVAIHDAIQVIAYFNYINRVADAMHVELEPEMPPYPDGSRG